MNISIEQVNGSVLSGMYYEAKNTRACIIMVHGLGEHTGRYSGMAEYFNKHNYSFIGLDLPGHGNSDGKRGHIDDFGIYNEVISAMKTYVQEQAGNIPLIIYGHSLGGAIALNYLKDDRDCRCAIITSPWLKLSFEPSGFKMRLASFMKRIYPSLLQPSGLDPDDISSDPEVVRNYISDGLVHSKISVSLFSGASDNAAALLACRECIKIPLLLMHGSKDRITSPEGSVSFAENNSMVEYKLWEGGYHELHNEVFREKVLQYIINWLEKQDGIQNEN